MEDDGLGDWRYAAASRLAKDVPAAYPGGPSHKAGAPVYQSALVKTVDGENIAFTAPSATAMALNVARKAANHATTLHEQLEYRRVVTPDGPGKGICTSSDSRLFDFFEQCMVSAVFSYHALEVFCNHTISREVNQAVDVKRRGKRSSLRPSELERQLSTEEKLSQVLPKLKGLPTPKGKAVWEPFKRLKEVRDSTVHLKSGDQYTIDRESLFFQFLSRRANEYPAAAVAMIRYFSPEGEPRWLRLLEDAAE